MMKPSVANRNMPAAMKPRPPVARPIVATSTIEPRLPSIGIAFISTPLAPSLGSIWGGGWSTICPVGISGASSRVPRSVVVTWSRPLVPSGRARWSAPSSREYPVRAGLTPRKSGEGDAVAGTHAPADILALSVHGPAGVLDLVVPASAVAVRRRRGVRPAGRADRRTRAAHQRRCADPAGQPADPGRRRRRRPARRDHRASAPVAGARTRPRRDAATAATGREPLSALWFCVAAAAAVLAGWCARTGSRRPAYDDRRAAPRSRPSIGVLPVGRFAPHRVVAAPGVRRRRGVRARLGPASRSGCRWSSASRALAAALAAAVGRALAPRAEEALRVWIIAGAAIFVAHRAVRARPVRRRGCVWSLLLVRRAARRPVRARPRGRRPGPVPHRPRAARGHRLVGARAADRQARPLGRPARRDRRGRDPRHPAASPPPARRSSSWPCSVRRCC